MVVGTWVIHRHPRYWDRPDVFDPDRFTPEREAARHRYAYLPFGAGPRACIGGSFALLEAVLATALIVRAYRLTTSSDPVPLAAGITLRPATSVPCTLQPIDPSLGGPSSPSPSSSRRVERTQAYRTWEGWSPGSRDRLRWRLPG